MKRYNVIYKSITGANMVVTTAEYDPDNYWTHSWQLEYLKRVVSMGMKLEYIH